MSLQTYHGGEFHENFFGIMCCTLRLGGQHRLTRIDKIFSRENPSEVSLPISSWVDANPGQAAALSGLCDQFHCITDANLAEEYSEHVFSDIALEPMTGEWSKQ